MTSNEAYIKFLQKVNKNFTNDNIAVDRGRFVQLFNEAQNKFIEWSLNKRNVDEVREIQNLVVIDKNLSEEGKFVEHQNFKLPSDYFDFNNVKAFASKDKCKNKRIYLYEIKHENVEEVLMDKFNKPSFPFREAPYTIGSNSVNIYNGDFKIDKVLLNYYRKPVQLDIDGYIRVDGSQSSNADPEFDDDVVDRILSIAAKDFNINSDNYNRFNLDKDRIISDI